MTTWARYIYVDEVGRVNSGERDKTSVDVERKAEMLMIW